MANSEWLQALAHRPELWYEKMEDNYPEELCRMYTGLKYLAESGAVYGFLLKLKDTFEAMIRWYALTGVAYAEHLEKKELTAILCDPDRSMSFGDWVNELPLCLTDDRQLADSPVGRILARLKTQYNSGKVVKWRNDTIGHGALQPDASEAFQNSLEDSLSTLASCLKDNETLAKQITYFQNTARDFFCTADNVTFCLKPFIREIDGDIRLSDSMSNKWDECTELSYRTGQRSTVHIPYLFELRIRYYGDAPITGKGTFDEEIYTERVESALRFYHGTDRYWKQGHYMNWLTQCFQQHDRGVFLLESESGTGKSTFSHYLDGFGKAALKKQGFTCRAYFFSRMSYRTKREFTNALKDMLTQSPEDDDRLNGSNWPALTIDTKPEMRGDEMAFFLKTFREYHKRYYGRQKILLVLDGIDEISPENTDLLYFVPDPAILDEGIYVLITYRSEFVDATIQQDFIGGFPFTERKTFKSNEENKNLLKKAVRESISIDGRTLSEDEIDQVCTVLNDRFTGLPVIRAVLEHEKTLGVLQNSSSLLSVYMEFLRQCYGAERFTSVKTVLLTLALAYEPLSVRMISKLAMNYSPSVELLAIMRDITPLLQSVRDHEGAKYILGHSDFGAQLREELAECRVLVERWQQEISGELDLQHGNYESITYIAGGMYLWSKDILREHLMNPALLENMAKIAGYYSKSKSTALHLSRMTRIFGGVEQGMTELWKNSGDMQYAIKALDASTACIPNLVELEDRIGCQKIEQSAQELTSLLPAGTDDREEFALVFFANYTNRATMAEKFGDIEMAQAYYEKAVDILFSHSECIPNEQQIPFIHNRGIHLLHTNPDTTIAICNRELAFPGCSPFDRANALLLKADALKAIIPAQQQEAGKCIREAVALAEREMPRNRMDAEIYPHALLHLGRHLCNAERDFEEAISVLSKVLAIYDMQYKLGTLPDRFTGAQVLSCIGASYYGIDQRSGNEENKEQSLWYCNQSILVYRKAREEGIRFRPASAEPIFVNAAFAYHYYKEYDAAISLLDELMQMQNISDPLTAQIQARCASVRQELMGGRPSAQ